MMKQSNDQTMKEAIDGMLKAYKLEGKIQQVKLIESWPKLMGPAVASRTSDLKIMNGKLFVSLSSAALRQELFQEREKITRLLNEEAGAEVIDEVVFR